MHKSVLIILRQDIIGILKWEIFIKS
jgi:hypothetical protein